MMILSCHAAIGDLVLELLQVLQEDGPLGPTIACRGRPKSWTMALPSNRVPHNPVLSNLTFPMIFSWHNSISNKSSLMFGQTQLDVQAAAGRLSLRGCHDGLQPPQLEQCGGAAGNGPAGNGGGEWVHASWRRFLERGLQKWNPPFLDPNYGILLLIDIDYC